MGTRLHIAGEATRQVTRLGSSTGGRSMVASITRRWADASRVRGVAVQKGGALASALATPRAQNEAPLALALVSTWEAS